MFVTKICCCFLLGVRDDADGVVVAVEWADVEGWGDGDDADGVVVSEWGGGDFVGRVDEWADLECWGDPDDDVAGWFEDLAEVDFPQLTSVADSAEVADVFELDAVDDWSQVEISV